VSFKCDYCGETAPKNTVCRLVPVDTRDRTYRHRDGQIIGYGTEIVRELKQCEGCAPKTVVIDGARYILTPGVRVAFEPPTAPARPGIARFDRE
jgi:hypothetical protein